MILVLAAPAYGDDLVCFDVLSAERLVADLDAASITSDALGVCRSQTNIQRQLLDNCLAIRVALEEQVVDATDAINELHSMAQEDDKLCRQLIEAAQPTFWDKMTWFLSGGGAGIGVVLLLVVLI
jgi:hypothetical protein